MTLERDSTVSRLSAEHVPEATRVLASAFHEYPVMRYVLGRNTAGYEERLRTLIEMFVMARVLRDEPILGIRRGDDLAGVALMSDPDGPPSPPEFAALRDEVWATLGSPAQLRYEAFGTACKPLTVDVPHLHLNMIGVRPDLQGLGFSAALLGAVHQLARQKSGSQGVTLTTENSANISLYEHFGYRVIGHATVDTQLETWGLFRPN